MYNQSITETKTNRQILCYDIIETISRFMTFETKNKFRTLNKENLKNT